MEFGRIYRLGYIFTEISFNNIVYEYHGYPPRYYTGQLSSATYRLQYPQDDIIVPLSNAKLNYLGGVWDVGQYNNNSANTWQVLQNNTPETVPDSNINVGQIQIYLNNLDSNTTVTIDEIKVSEYDNSNNFIKNVFYDDFSSNFEYQLIEDATGATSGAAIQNSTNGGYLGSSAKIIQGPTTDNTVLYRTFYVKLFKVNPNDKYQMSVHIKVQNPGANTVIRPMIIYYQGDGVAPLNKSYIEAFVQPYIDYSNQKNVPIFMGEYGVDNWCFKELKNVSDGTLHMNGDLGGEQWIDDMFSIIRDNKLNSSYWQYSISSPEEFALYGGDINNPKTYINEYLENAFINYFSKF